MCRKIILISEAPNALAAVTKSLLPIEKAIPRITRAKLAQPIRLIITTISK